MKFTNLPKLKKGDKVAIVSPSFAAPGQWPDVYKMALDRLQNDFNLIPVEYPATAKIGANGQERAEDLIAAFLDPNIKGVIATIGGSDQVTYIKNLPKEVFINNPKPFYGFSDNTHFANFLWLCGLPSYYGASLFTQFAMPGKIDDFTKKYLNIALFENGKFELESSPVHCEFSTTTWDNIETMQQERNFIKNNGWNWDTQQDKIFTGISWGGCLESIDEILRHNLEIPSLDQFENIILFLETSEEQPDAEYVFRVLRALGSRGILEKIQGVLVGRPETWSMDSSKSHQNREDYRQTQAKTILETIRTYNQSCPVIQNMDFGHTHPQIPMPNGRQVWVDTVNKKIVAEY